MTDQRGKQIEWKVDTVNHFFLFFTQKPQVLFILLYFFFSFLAAYVLSNCFYEHKVLFLVEVWRGLHKNIKQGCDPRDWSFDPVMRSSDTLPAELQMGCTVKQN